MKPHTYNKKIKQFVNVFEQSEVLKKIWYSPEAEQEKKNKGEQSAFTKYILARFFSEEEQKSPRRCFCWFCTTLVRLWKKEEEREEQETTIKNFSDESIDTMQKENRRRTIYLLNQILKEYQGSGKYDEANLREIISLYDRIQAAEEAAKRTELAKKKEARESAITFFNLAAQYGKLPEGDIKRLRELLEDARSNRQQIQVPTNAE